MSNLNSFFYRLFGAILFCVGIALFWAMVVAFNLYLDSAKQSLTQSDEILYEGDAEYSKSSKITYEELIATLMTTPECNINILPNGDSSYKIIIVAGPNTDTHVSVLKDGESLYDEYYGIGNWDIAKFPFNLVPNADYRRSERVNGKGEIIDVTYTKW